MVPNTTNIYHVQTMNVYNNYSPGCQSASSFQSAPSFQNVPSIQSVPGYQPNYSVLPQNYLINPLYSDLFFQTVPMASPWQPAPTYTPSPIPSNSYPSTQQILESVHNIPRAVLNGNNNGEQSKSLEQVLTNLEAQMEALNFEDIWHRRHGRTTTSEDLLRQRILDQMRQHTPGASFIFSSYETDAGVPESLTPNEIDRLPKITCAQPGESCSICTDPISVGEYLCLLPCTHQFHYDCSRAWLLCSNTCPLCRHVISFDDDSVSSANDSDHDSDHDSEDVEEPPSLESTDKEELDKTEVLIETTDE
jgi:hypothetical protein